MLSNSSDIVGLCLYGFGGIGRYVFDLLKRRGIQVCFVVDENLAGRVVDDVEVISLEQVQEKEPGKIECIVSLHNHYVDLRYVWDELSKVGFAQVSSLFRVRDLVPDFNLSNGYWLDFDFNLANFEKDLAFARNLFSDRKSVETFEQVVRYRKAGRVADCPVPSTSDEYFPLDLPRYKNPINLIDCGAFTGVAIKRLEKAGYFFRDILAFEPDAANYQKLLLNDTPANLKIFLPLATHSDDAVLSFSANGGMASRLDSNGGVQIQASRIDSIQFGFAPTLIKFDVEGAEIASLVGGRNTIKTYRPNLCVSVYHRPAHIFEIVSLIHSWECGYKFYLRVHEYNTFGLVLYCLNDILLEI